jgi:hypothetical protein
MARQEVPSGAGFSYEVATRFLDEQLGRIEALDAKAGVLIAADGVLAGLLFVRGSLVAQAPKSLAFTAVIALILSLSLALVAFSNRRYESAPAPEAVARFMRADEQWLRWRFIGNMLDALEVNRGKLEWKARFFTGALLGLIVSVGTLGGYFLYGLMRGSVGGA